MNNSKIPFPLRLPPSPVTLVVQVLKVLLVVGVGFIYSLVTTTFSVMALRRAQGTLVKSVATKASSTGVGGSRKKSPPPKPFGDQTMDFFMKGSILFGLASVVATKTDNGLATPLQTLFLGFSTVAGT